MYTCTVFQVNRELKKVGKKRLAQCGNPIDIDVDFDNKRNVCSNKAEKAAYKFSIKIIKRNFKTEGALLD